MVGKKRMTTTQGITTASGTRIRRIAQMNALADVVVNVYAPVMKQGSIIVTPTASAETHAPRQSQGIGSRHSQRGEYGIGHAEVQRGSPSGGRQQGQQEQHDHDDLRASPTWKNSMRFATSRR